VATNTAPAIKANPNTVGKELKTVEQVVSHPGIAVTAAIIPPRSGIINKKNRNDNDIPNNVSIFDIN
jgi:hypothetical protein